MSNKTPLDLRLTLEGRNIRVTNQIGAEAEEFERALLVRQRLRPYEDGALPLHLNLPQQTVWVKNTDQDALLIQISTADGLPAAQVVATIYHPRRTKWFRHAIVHAMGCSFVSHEEELWLYKTLPGILKNARGVSRLRLQAMRLAHADLMDFDNLARRAGYSLTDPLAVTRTLAFDIQAPIDEILASLGSKTRAKVRHHGLEKIEIRTIADDASIPALKVALAASFSRTKGGEPYLEFNDLLRVAKERPDLVLIQGLYLKHRPDDLLAYSIVLRHGDVVESFSSGSLPDSELRKLPFNYFLLWGRIPWAQAHGGKVIDLGGVTDGGTTDPLAGISQFKRHFCEKQLETGREMVLETSPLRCFLFNALVAMAGHARQYLRKS